jgi:phospholipid N-methyltransferase
MDLYFPNKCYCKFMSVHHAPPMGEIPDNSTEALDPVIDVKQQPFFNTLHHHDKELALISQNAINALMREGFINPRNLKSIFEFGAGVGASTLALTELAKINGAEIDVAEYIPDKAKMLLASRLVSNEDVFVGDGVEILSRLSSNGQLYDLVYAAMFFPEGQNPMVQKFLETARQALRQDGKVVLYSDWETREKVLDACKTYSFHYEQLTAPLSTNPLFTQVEDILIFSNSAQAEGSSPTS